MTKKTALLAATAIIALTLATGSAAQAQNTVNKDGTVVSDFYVGGFGGWGWTDADYGGQTFDLNGSDWGVFAGYNLGGWLDRHMNIGLQGGIEGHYAWSSDSDETRIIAGVPTKIGKRHEWGVDFRPGLSFISDAMPMGLRPYAILGYRQTEFRNEAAGLSNDSLYHGFDLGVGTELIAFNNFGVRLDYNHVFYKDNNGIDPDENDLRLGVAYHF